MTATNRIRNIQATSREHTAIAPAGSDRQRGSALLLALLVMGALSLIGTTLVLTSVAERRTSGYYRDSMQALAAAETGLAFAKRAIQDMTITMGDMDSDGRPDFGLSDTLSWGGEYEILGEASDITGLGIAAYRANGYTIVGEGRYAGTTRRVKCEIVHDSFLKYARFVSAAGTGYGCGAVLTGEVYVGGDLGVPVGCGASAVQFLEFVAAVGDIPNAGSGIFHRGYVTDADQIDLGNSADFNVMRNIAKGIHSECDCEGIGEVGIYFNIAGGVDPLSIGAGTLNLSLFNYYDDITTPGDSTILYSGVPVTNTLTGSALTYREFNGVIFFEADAPVEGTLDGQSARCLSIFATDDIVITNPIVTGHTGFDPVTGLPNNCGDPVNVGLIAFDYVYLSKFTPRVLQIDAALMSCTENWRCIDATDLASHPVSGPGPLDLDLDGISGETPFNNDPTPGSGWDELNIDANTWVLNISGPIITDDGGSARPWNSGSVLASASGPTRRYNYDMDITDFPPPCFPVPLNLWKDVSWTEIFETEAALATYLP
ncbi:MAG: pilus assembly PilX N-terminal domain-containing protein [Candidatus Eisenbacteria sp.]|nr:pilus assembly PilX N-terminal domain-containing protein [Candidatus Eisenbacteria bacterium]